MISYATDTWLDVDEATALSMAYIDKYRPDRHKITLLTRDWMVEVTQLPVSRILGLSREIPLVNARFLWANALWAAGYSFPQISRAMYRKDHSTSYHMIYNKKIAPEMAPYRRVAVRMGKVLSERRVSWLDHGDMDASDPLTINDRRSGSKDHEKRILIMRALEAHMDPSDALQVPVSRVSNVLSADVRRTMLEAQTMADLKSRFKREVAGA